MTLDGEKLTAEYNWRGTFGSYAMKAPRRQAFLQKALEIQVGQWGRILYNERHTDFDFGIWGYGKHVFNIGLFVNPLPDVFLTTPPIKTYSKLALLF